MCAGPARASQTIREALAKGADRAIHIEEENLNAFDTLGIAKLLAAAVKSEKPDLILTGLQSDDLGYGQTGVVLAEVLGLPHGTIIMAVEKTDSGIRVKRELEDGWFQHVEMPLPAVLTIQSGINKLRYATLMGIKKAKTKEIKRLTVAELGVSAATTAVIERVYVPQRTKQTQILEGNAERLRRNWWRSSSSRCGSYERRSGDHGAARRRVESHVVGDAGGRPAAGGAIGRDGIRGGCGQGIEALAGELAARRI